MIQAAPEDVAARQTGMALPVSRKWHSGPLARCWAATARNFITALPEWSLYCLTSPQTIVVLGMHRSGTSCIARMIHACGAAVGEVIGGNQWNQEGHWEAREGLEINDYILRLSGGAWDKPPTHLLTDCRIRWRMRGFLGRLHRNGTAVWKDPRTVLTFPLWKPLFRQYLIVATFRHPLSVAQSLMRRDGFDRKTGLDLWRRYNEQVLAITNQENNVLWIDFDADRARLLRAVEAVSQRAGLQFHARVADFYEPQLRTSDADDSPDNDDVVQLYEKLKSMSSPS